MALLLITFVIICLSVAGLSVGVLMGRKPLKGSCGGLNKFTEGEGCDLCGGSAQQCEELKRVRE